jgi:hypothetical protein
MRDEHFYTRCLKLNPEKAVEYYIGRADFYCVELAYEKAYQDFCKALELGADLSKNSKYKICMKYKEAEKRIFELTEEIKKKPENAHLYYERSHYYLLKNKIKDAFDDMYKITELSPYPDSYSLLNDLCDKIQEYNINNMVKKAKGKDLINAYKERIKYAEIRIKLYRNREYWQWRAEHDLDEILKLAKDKVLALYLRVNFYENINNKGNAIFYCKKVVEEARKQKNKTLLYLYATKLIALYANEEEYKKAMEIAVYYPDKPASEDLRKGLKYINDFADMDVDVIRKNIRTSMKRDKK